MSEVKETVIDWQPERVRARVAGADLLINGSPGMYSWHVNGIGCTFWGDCETLEEAQVAAVECYIKNVRKPK